MTTNKFAVRKYRLEVQLFVCFLRSQDFSQEGYLALAQDAERSTAEETMPKHPPHATRLGWSRFQSWKTTYLHMAQSHKTPPQP